MILEMVFRRDAFEQMGRWNYHNPAVLELRYEQIIGNEAECFRQLFEHYRFHPRVRERGVEAGESAQAGEPKKARRETSDERRHKTVEDQAPAASRRCSKKRMGNSSFK